MPYCYAITVSCGTVQDTGSKIYSFFVLSSLNVDSCFKISIIVKLYCWTPIGYLFNMCSSARSSQLFPRGVNHCQPQASFGFAPLLSEVHSVLSFNCYIVPVSAFGVWVPVEKGFLSFQCSLHSRWSEITHQSKMSSFSD